MNKVIVDEADHRMELVVPDEKLSLAIGRKGQNVRLASQLTGWKLDIISESKFKQMEEEALAAFRQMDGIDEELARAMYRLGFRALEELAEASIEELVTIDGVGNPESRAGAARPALTSTMERLRSERIARAKTQRSSRSTERDILRLVQGVGVRTQQLLEEGGYRSDPGRRPRGSGPARHSQRALAQEGARRAGRAPASSSTRGEGNRSGTREVDDQLARPRTPLG